MPIELPPLSAKVTADLTPIAAAFTAAQQQARGFKANFEQTFSDIGKSITNSMNVAKSAMFQVVQGGSGFENFKLALRPKIGGNEAEIRQQMADYVRKMREAAHQQQIDVEVKARLFGAPDAAADLAKKLKVFEMQGSNSVGPESLTSAMQEAAADAASKIGPVMAKASADGVAKAGKEAGNKFAGGFLDEVSQGLSIRNSTFGKLARLAAGGGIVGGLGLAAGEIDKLATAAETFAVDMSKGGDAARQAAASMLASIPIVGQLGDAGYKIWQIASGEAVAVAQINQEMEAQELHMKNVQKAFEETSGWADKSRREVESIAESIEAMHMSGVPLKLFEIDNDIRHKIEDIKAAMPGIHAESSKSFTAEIQANNKRLTELYTEQASLRDKLQISAGPHATVGDMLNMKFDHPTPEMTGTQDALRDNLALIKLYESKNRNAHDQIKKDEVTAAADAQKQIDALTKEGIEKRAQVMRDMLSGPMMADWKTFTGDIVKEWDKGVEEFTKRGEELQRPFDALQERLDTMGMSSGQRAVYDFKKLMPDSDSLQAFEDLAKSADMSDMAKQADDWAKSLDGPIEKYGELAEKLQQWHDAKAITDDQFAKGMGKAQDDALAGLMGRDEAASQSRFAPAVRAGSADAARLQAGNAAAEQAARDRKKMVDLLGSIVKDGIAVKDTQANFMVADF